VTRGYWNLPELTRDAFIAVGTGAPWYRTGDIVREEADGNLRYLGRRDRMIKKRGYRVELGEIEACLTLHPDIREAGVVALADATLGMKVHAHIATRDGARLSIIALKSFCAERIPVYMVPDVFIFHPALPMTSTLKIDYQTLEAAS
jgi:acyl-coenzyme A synthetase/AMP-(fatty) acid ligase